MCSEDISIVILQEITLTSLKYTKRTTCKPCSVLPCLYTSAARLNTNHLYIFTQQSPLSPFTEGGCGGIFFLKESMEKPHGIASTSNTGYKIIRESALGIEYLPSRLSPDN